MLKPIAIAAVVLALTLSPAGAADTRKPAPPDPRQAAHPHQGPSGKRYQYDLTNPGDQIRYEIDPAAQIRDQISVDPRIDLDRDLGRPGGGAAPF